MIKKLLFILLIAQNSHLFAQTIKTDVLVIGGSPGGVAAAIQSARSKVKTAIVAENIHLTDDGRAGDMLIIEPEANISSGIWAEFYKRVLEFKKSAGAKDTAYNAPLHFEKNTGEAILKKIADTVKNLSVYFGASFTSIKKNGDFWEIKITQNGKSIEVKARVIIDATENGEVVEKAGAKLKRAFESDDSKGFELYRTSIAAGIISPNNNRRGSYWYVPMTGVLPIGVDNLLVTERILAGSNNIQYLPMQTAIGQGVGAMAAYCAFFKTSTEKLRVRIIQGELLDFKAYLLPLSDIPPADHYWRAFQQVCATGLLKSVKQNGQFVFDPDATVSTAEIEPTLKEIYTRAFLWFNKEKPGEKFTVANTLSLISDYTLTDPLVLNARIKSDWKARYKFTLDFDMKRPITRREFAVLANRYLNPFARTVDLNGRLVN